MPDRRSLIDILREKKDGSMKRRRKYSAEFICEKPEIQKALDESFSVREIWDVLASTKRITMPYETFLRYVKHSQMAVAAVAAKSLETPKKGKKTKVPDLTNALQNAPSFELKPQKPAAFTHDPNPDPSKLI